MGIFLSHANGANMSSMITQTSGEPPTSTSNPAFLLGLAAALLVLFAIVVAALIKRIRRERTAKLEEASAAAAATADAEATDKDAPATKTSEDEPRVSVALSTESEDDLTRLKAFSKDMLPNLAMDDEDDDDVPVEHSKAEVRFIDATLAGAEEPTGASELFVTEVAAKSDVGKKRKRNEDAVLAEESLDLYVVCDGMGGYAGGDVAAATAAEEVKKAILADDQTPAAEVPPETPPTGKQLVRAVERANAAIWERGSKNPALTGMGTTIVTALFHRKKNRVYVAHVGDSRLYRYRAGKLSQLTVDHTLGAKGVVGPLALTVRRAVGTQPDVKVDVVVDKPEPEDLYLLCTDGVYGMVKAEELTKMLEEKKPAGWRKPVLNELADKVIAAANAAGGKDNATILLVGIRAPSGGGARA
jgi:serine/threonine protein phosphatase PrpC